MILNSSNRRGVPVRQFISVILWVFITLLELILLSNEDFYKESYTPLAILIGINFIMHIVTLRRNQIRLTSFFFVFILCYYIFHFGEVIMMGLFPHYEYDYINYISVYMRDKDALYKTFLVCVVCINTFFIGGICSGNRNKYDLSSNDFDTYANLHGGKVLFFLLLPIRLYLDLRALFLGLAGTYGSTLATSFHGGGVLSALGEIWYITIPIYYLEIKNEKNRRLLLISSISYMCLMMLSGGRGHRVIAIMALLIIVLLTNERISFGKTLKYSIIVLMGLFFLDIIFDMRGIGASAYFSNLGTYLHNSFQRNILFETIGSFGETIYTPYLVIEGYGTKFHPFFGEGFIKSFASIIPDAFGWFSNTNNEAIFSKMLQTNHTIGGSFVGDLYYNFGPLYFLFSALIGWIYMKLSLLINQAVIEHNMKYVYRYMPFLGLSLWWIRDSIGGLTRNVVWAMLLLFIVNNIGRSRQTRNSNIAQSFSVNKGVERN